MHIEHISFTLISTPVFSLTQSPIDLHEIRSQSVVLMIRYILVSFILLSIRAHPWDQRLARKTRL